MNNGARGKGLPKGKAKELNGLVQDLLHFSFGQPCNHAEWLAQHRNMVGVLDRIRRIEPKLRTTNGQSRMENVHHFTRWAIEQGCKVGNVRVAEHTEYGGLGLESTGHIPAGQRIVTVPRKLFFYVPNEPRYRKLLAMMPNAKMSEQGNVMLALALIIERFGANSFWKPYLDVLPDRYTTPLYYTPEDMAELHETEASLPALKLCKQIARQYIFIRNYVQDRVDELRDCFTYDVFRWAVSTVMTRQNKVPVNLAGFDGMDFTLALIPFWDMANHAYPDAREQQDRCVAETCYNATDGQLECALTREVSATSPVPIFIVYGKRTDAEFLVHNGFVCPRNPYTSLTKRFTVPRSMVEKQAHLLELLGIPSSGMFAFGLATGSQLPEPISPELVAIARVQAMAEQELDHYIALDATERQKLCCSYRSDLPDKLCEGTDRTIRAMIRIC
uniref:protein-histidine N-methyltransferase n=1 Tax=Anopheles stephensi TaxID=30069 RepID=A0A182XVY3_ANOST